MVRYVIGDIHGKFACLQEVLNIVQYDPREDTLYCLGDVCDGGYNTKKCIDLLIRMKAKLCLANHDNWALHWMETSIELPEWVNQGGLNTLRSYDFDIRNVPKSHILYLRSAMPYIVDDENNIFVHGGFNPEVRIEFQDPHYIMWDRSIIEYARNKPIPEYNHVFIGHTSTMMFGVTEPIIANNLIMLDTGAGWRGKLTIMNVDTLQWWQNESDNCSKNDKLTYYYKRLSGLKV